MPKPESEPIRSPMKEEARIRVGIEADPDTLELDDGWFAKARLASEAHPRIVERYRRRRGKQRTPTKGPRTLNRLDRPLAIPPLLTKRISRRESRTSTVTRNMAATSESGATVVDGLSDDVRIGWRRKLRQARGAVQRNAQGFLEVASVVESLAGWLQANLFDAAPQGLWNDAAAVQKTLFPGTAWTDGGISSPDALYDALRKHRNTRVHYGATARNAGARAMRLSLILEESLMPQKKTAETFMTPDPVTAEPWYSVSEVRAKLLEGGYSALPLWHQGEWKLITDTNVMRYVRQLDQANGSTFKQGMNARLENVVNGANPKPRMGLETARSVHPDTQVDTESGQWPEQGETVLVVDGTDQRCLRGVLTAQDLLV